MRLLKCFVALALLLAVTVPAGAISFNQPYNGPIVIKIGDQDMGTIYPDSGYPQGFSWVGGSPSPDLISGIQAMNLFKTTTGQATAAQSVTIVDPTTGHSITTLEDSWGIAKVTGIYKADGVSTLWLPGSTDGSELTVMFWGEVDFYAQSFNGVSYMSGVNMHYAVYQDFTPDYSGAAGSAGRTAIDQYTTVTDGTKVLEGKSRAGFLYADTGKYSGAGGSTTEFASQFDFGSLTGNGSAYVDVTGGTDQVQFDTNTFFTPASGANGIPDGADMKFQFTTDPSFTWPGTDWLVGSNDPIKADVIPEPLTMLGVFLGVSGLGGYLRRRFA